jgi:hypothetical protein
VPSQTEKQSAADREFFLFSSFLIKIGGINHSCHICTDMTHVLTRVHRATLADAVPHQ